MGLVHVDPRFIPSDQMFHIGDKALRHFISHNREAFGFFSLHLTDMTFALVKHTSLLSENILLSGLTMNKKKKGEMTDSHRHEKIGPME